MAELHKEYESRFNEQKWEVYTEFVRTMGQISSATNVGKKPDYTEIGPEYREVISRLLLVASDGQVLAGRSVLSDMPVHFMDRALGGRSFVQPVQEQSRPAR